jgi:hypothetical protein
MRGRPIAPLLLSQQERAYLERQVHRPRVARSQSAYDASRRDALIDPLDGCENWLSHTTIRRLWAAFGLQPHRSQTFKLSSDPLFVDKVRDIVCLYLSPPNRALVFSIE